jgi:antagonist of KipI
MITILKPGLLSTIQDLGRYGFQKYGVIVSGAMDSIAHRLANLLVGNEENKPTIEMTLVGPVIQFEQDSLIAITGGDLSPTIDQTPLPNWKAIFVKKGTKLKFSGAQKGCRAYLAISGGFSTPSIMGSQSTYLRAGIGGYKGRALRAGDQLLNEPPNEIALKIIKNMRKELFNHSFIEMNWSISREVIPDIHSKTVIRIMKGRQFELFAEESIDQLFHNPFSITAQSDRMGFRLKGPTLQLEEPKEMISESVTMGTIQVPVDGNPIILMADRQTTGGYPVLGHIASVDLPLIAQSKPGDLIYFSEITHEEAQLLYLKREITLNQIKLGISQKYC